MEQIMGHAGFAEAKSQGAKGEHLLLYSFTLSLTHKYTNTNTHLWKGQGEKCKEPLLHQSTQIVDFHNYLFSIVCNIPNSSLRIENYFGSLTLSLFSSFLPNQHDSGCWLWYYRAVVTPGPIVYPSPLAGTPLSLSLSFRCLCLCLWFFLCLCVFLYLFCPAAEGWLVLHKRGLSPL